MNNLLNNINLPIKMSLIGLLAFISLIIPVTYFYNSSVETERIANLELVGMEFVNQTITLRKTLAEHRGTTARIYGGDTTANAARFEKSTLIDGAFDQLERQLVQHQDSKLITRIQGLQRNWETIKSNIVNQSIDGRMAFKLHSDLISNIGRLSAELMKKFLLYYDPSSASYHAIMTNYIDVPRLANSLGKVRGKGAGILARGTITQLERGEMEGFINGTIYPSADFVSNLTSAADVEPRFIQYKEQTQTFQTQLNELFDLAHDEIINAENITLSAALFFDEYTSVINAIYDFNANSILILRDLLNERIADTVRERNIALSIILSSFILCLLFSLLIVKSITGSISQIKTRFDHIIDGDFSQTEHTQQKDEFGILNNNLSDVTDALAQANEKAGAAFRIKQALDNSSTAFILSDTKRSIMYANASARKMLAAAEHEISSDIGQFNANNIKGTHVDIFFKGVPGISHLLDNLTEEYVSTLRLGNVDLRLIVNPIFNEDNSLAGYSTELHDMTEVFEEDRRKQRILESLNSTTTNVMIADADRNIIYLNKAVNNMLSECEQDLREVYPKFKAENVLGGSMDIFHKNPAHQASMLAALQNTHTAQVTIGKRHFRLIANPIISDTGERLGSVVEWLDRTKEVIAEKEISAMVDSALQGDFSYRASKQHKEGFLLKMSEGLNELMQITESGLNDVSSVLMAMSNGDLTQRVEAEYQGTFNELKQYCNNSCDNLANMIAEIRESASTINTASSEIAQGNMDLSSRTEEQASSLEETASSMDEISGTINLNAQNAEKANHLAADASSVACNGGELIEQVVKTMASINDSADQISNIIGVIDSIAFQTNILALNAAVEAARAGEQGRGFAVVAAEVRTLAQRSANAAKDIKTLISDSVSKVTTGNELVHKSGQTMQEIVVSIQRVNDIMGEIAAASRQQAASIGEVNNAIAQMDEMTQQNAALVEQAAASSESLRGQSSLLNQSISSFQLSETLLSTLSTSTSNEPRVSGQLSVEQRSLLRTDQAPRKNLKPQSPSPEDEWESF